MPAFTYTGDVEQVYPQYLDAAKGSTLVAEPGQTYDVTQVADTVADGNGGREPLTLAMPPDDRWSSPAPPAPLKSSSKSAKENG